MNGKEPVHGAKPLYGRLIQFPRGSAIGVRGQRRPEVNWDFVWGAVIGATVMFIMWVYGIQQYVLVPKAMIKRMVV